MVPSPLSVGLVERKWHQLIGLKLLNLVTTGGVGAFPVIFKPVWIVIVND